jgi:hypothetical protein
VPVYVMMPLDIVTMNNTESEEGDERKLAGTEERKGGGDNDGRVMGVGGERHAGHLQRIGGFIGSDRTCSEPPLLTTMTKTTTADLTQTTIVEGLLCNIWVYFLVFFDGFAPVWVFWFFSLVFSMAPVTFRVIKCSNFRMKKILKRVNIPL